MVRTGGAKVTGHCGFAQPHPMADVIYSLGRGMRGVGQFVTVAKPKARVIDDASRTLTQSTTHPFYIRKNLIPEETPNFDHAADELVVIYPRELGI